MASDSESVEEKYYELNTYYGIQYSYKFDDQVIAALKANPTYAPLTTNEMDGEIQIGENKIRPNVNSVDGDGNRCFFYADKMTFYGRRKYAPEDVYGIIQPVDLMKCEDTYGDAKKFFDELFMYLQNALVASGIALNLVQRRMQRGWFYLVYTGGEEAPVVVKKEKPKKAPKEKVAKKKKSPKKTANVAETAPVDNNQPPVEPPKEAPKKEKKPRSKKEN